MTELTMFHDSVAWQKSMDLSVAVYAATSSFPKQEIFGVTNQLRRASVSIPSNIAEGKGRLSSNELLHFLGIARGSALEVQTQLELSIRLNFGNKEQLSAAKTLAIEVARILNSSIATLRSRQTSKPRRA
ncbi:MAG: four helix bundle protein [Acidobacteriaceae bacterium]